MTGFRVLLAAIFETIAVYTAVVIADHGMNLLPVFFGDMAKMEWPGQFNLDSTVGLSRRNRARRVGGQAGPSRP